LDKQLTAAAAAALILIAVHAPRTTYRGRLGTHAVTLLSRLS